MNTLYIYLLIFACIAYLILTDESIARAVTLLSQIIKFQFDKTKWIILNDPRNPIVKYFMWKRAYKLAEELQKELEDKSK
jgi:predicted transcriptional regulator